MLPVWHSLPIQMYALFACDFQQCMYKAIIVFAYTALQTANVKNIPLILDVST